MKNPLYLKIILGALLLIILICIFWGIGASHKISKLQADYNIAVGKNTIYVMDAQKLTDSISKLNTTYSLYKRKTDSLTKIYVKGLQERDLIILKYKKEHQEISHLSAMGGIKYFNSKIGELSPPIIISITPDTSFNIPDVDIKKANEIFIQRDEYKETNDNLKKAEGDLLKINENLKLEIGNRQSSVDKLTELVKNKDGQISNYQTQVKDLSSDIKKEKRKATFQKIGIGAAGIVAVILALTL